jgi:hypothetical protein
MCVCLIVCDLETSTMRPPRVMSSSSDISWVAAKCLVLDRDTEGGIRRVFHRIRRYILRYFLTGEVLWYVTK